MDSDYLGATASASCAFAVVAGEEDRLIARQTAEAKRMHGVARNSRGQKIRSALAFIAGYGSVCRVF
jgi:hypothetical protein